MIAGILTIAENEGLGQSTVGCCALDVLDSPPLSVSNDSSGIVCAVALHDGELDSAEALQLPPDDAWVCTVGVKPCKAAPAHSMRLVIS
jgi:hypothetical protein